MIAVVVFLFEVVCGVATSNDCNAGSCSTNADCMYNQICCNGKCYSQYALPGQVALGGSCVPGSTVCSQMCAQGTCSGTSHLCYLAGIGPSCATSCASDSDCTFGMKCNGGVCGTGTLGPGAACNAANLCTTGFSCVSGICTASVVGQPCTATIFYNDVNGVWTSNCTQSSAYCNTTGSSGFGICLAKVANGQLCGGHSLSASCQSGICNYNGATSLCIQANSIAVGGMCAYDTECASSYCDVTSHCAAAHSLALGSPCYQYTNQIECVTGAFCSYNRTGSTYSCVSGSQYGGLAGTACVNDDQCGLGMNCTGASFYASGVCSSAIGTPCDPSNALSCIAHNTFSTTGTFGCYCSGGSYTCQISSNVVSSCSTQFAAVNALLGSGYGYNQYNILIAGPDSDRAVLYAYYCCLGCGLTATQFTNDQVNLQQLLTLSYNCATSTYSSLSVSDTTTRCTKDGTTAIALADQFGSCTAVTPSVSPTPVSVTPSVTITPSVSSSFSATHTVTPTGSPSGSVSASFTASSSGTPSPSVSSPQSPSQTGTASRSQSQTPSSSSTRSVTPTSSVTPTASLSVGASPSNTASVSMTSSSSSTSSTSLSASITPTQSQTPVSVSASLSAVSITSTTSSAPSSSRTTSPPALAADRAAPVTSAPPCSDMQCQLGVGVGLGAAVPILAIVIGLLIYFLYCRRTARQWDAAQAKAAEMPEYSDTSTNTDPENPTSDTASNGSGEQDQGYGSGNLELSASACPDQGGGSGNPEFSASACPDQGGGSGNLEISASASA